MVSLEEKINYLIARLALEFKRVRMLIGSLANLQTNEKSSLVGAVNELAGKSATINDAASSSATTYSANKIESAIANAKSELIGGADNLHDSFKEIQDLVKADAAGLAAFATALGNRVRFDEAQTLTEEQKARVLASIGAVAKADLGDIGAVDFVAVFDAALI